MSAKPAANDGPRTSYMVARLDRLLRSELGEALRPFDLSVTQYTLLSVLAHRPGLSNAQLARRSYITAQAMHQMVNGLERRGLIDREVSPHHGRVQLTRLTSDGVDLLERCDKAVSAVERRVFGRLGPTEEAHLRRLLTDIIDRERRDDG